MEQLAYTYCKNKYYKENQYTEVLNMILIVFESRLAFFKQRDAEVDICIYT